jgi:WD40 repeat protein
MRSHLVMCLMIPSSPMVAAPPPVTALAFAPEGKSVVVGSQSGIAIRTWPDLEHARELKTELSHVHDLAFSPDGKTLAAAGGAPGERGTVELFRWPGGELVRRFSPHRDLIYAVDWRADSAVFATASADGMIGIHNVALATPGRLLEGHSRPVLAAAFLPGNAGLVTAGVDASLRLWDADTGKPVRTMSNHTLTVHDLSVRPGDGRLPPMIASVSDDRTVRFWQPTLGRLVRFARLTSVPIAVAWAADGGSAAVACKDGKVRVIDPDTAAETGEYPGLDGVASGITFAPDGGMLIGGQGGKLRRVKR